MIPPNTPFSTLSQIDTLTEELSSTTLTDFSLDPLSSQILNNHPELLCYINFFAQAQIFWPHISGDEVCKLLGPEYLESQAKKLSFTLDQITTLKKEATGPIRALSVRYRVANPSILSHYFPTNPITSFRDGASVCLSLQSGMKLTIIFTTSEQVSFYATADAAYIAWNESNILTVSCSGYEKKWLQALANKVVEIPDVVQKTSAKALCHYLMRGFRAEADALQVLHNLCIQKGTIHYLKDLFNELIHSYPERKSELVHRLYQAASFNTSLAQDAKAFFLDTIDDTPQRYPIAVTDSDICSLETLLAANAHKSIACLLSFVLSVDPVAKPLQELLVLYNQQILESFTAYAEQVYNKMGVESVDEVGIIDFALHAKLDAGKKLLLKSKNIDLKKKWISHFIANDPPFACQLIVRAKQKIAASDVKNYLLQTSQKSFFLPTLLAAKKDHLQACAECALAETAEALSKLTEDDSIILLRCADTLHKKEGWSDQIERTVTVCCKIPISNRVARHLAPLLFCDRGRAFKPDLMCQVAEIVVPPEELLDYFYKQDNSTVVIRILQNKKSAFSDHDLDTLLWAFLHSLQNNRKPTDDALSWYLSQSLPCSFKPQEQLDLIYTIATQRPHAITGKQKTQIDTLYKALSFSEKKAFREKITTVSKPPKTKPPFYELFASVIASKNELFSEEAGLLLIQHDANLDRVQQILAVLLAQSPPDPNNQVVALLAKFFPKNAKVCTHFLSQLVIKLPDDRLEQFLDSCRALIIHQTGVEWHSLAYELFFAERRLNKKARFLNSCLLLQRCYQVILNKIDEAKQGKLVEIVKGFLADAYSIQDKDEEESLASLLLAMGPKFRKISAHLFCNALKNHPSNKVRCSLIFALEKILQDVVKRPVIGDKAYLAGFGDLALHIAEHGDLDTRETLFSIEFFVNAFDASRSDITTPFFERKEPISDCNLLAYLQKLSPFYKKYISDAVDSNDECYLLQALIIELSLAHTTFDGQYVIRYEKMSYAVKLLTKLMRYSTNYEMTRRFFIHILQAVIGPHLSSDQSIESEYYAVHIASADRMLSYRKSCLDDDIFYAHAAVNKPNSKTSPLFSEEQFLDLCLMITALCLEEVRLCQDALVSENKGYLLDFVKKQLSVLAEHYPESNQFLQGFSIFKSILATSDPLFEIHSKNIQCITALQRREPQKPFKLPSLSDVIVSEDTLYQMASQACKLIDETCSIDAPSYTPLLSALLDQCSTNRQLITSNRFKSAVEELLLAQRYSNFESRDLVTRYIEILFSNMYAGNKGALIEQLVRFIEKVKLARFYRGDYYQEFAEVIKKLIIVAILDDTLPASILQSLKFLIETSVEETSQKDAQLSLAIWGVHHFPLEMASEQFSLVCANAQYGVKYPQMAAMMLLKRMDLTEEFLEHVTNVLATTYNDDQISRREAIILWWMAKATTELQNERSKFIPIIFNQVFILTVLFEKTSKNFIEQSFSIIFSSPHPTERFFRAATAFLSNIKQENIQNQILITWFMHLKTKKTAFLLGCAQQFLKHSCLQTFTAEQKSDFYQLFTAEEKSKLGLKEE